MSEAVTQIHLVDTLVNAFDVARQLDADGIGLDVEGVLTSFIGNDPKESDLTRPLSPTEIVARHNISTWDHIGHGLMTNNTNRHFPGSGIGLLDQVVARLRSGNVELPFVHKGMILSDGTIVGAKPSGEQGLILSEMLDLNPANMVLIDDQGVKNAGEAVKAGFKAIIVPRPIGEKRLGVTIEHKGVMAFRVAEPMVYASLAKRGRLAEVAYRKVAGISLDQISDFVNHRAKTNIVLPTD